MTFFSLGLLIVILLAALMWRAAWHAKEIATKAGDQLCINNEVQFLDETVALKSLKLKWQGKPCFLRTYQFEYYDGDGIRKAGIIELLSHQVISVKMQGTRIDPENPPPKHQDKDIINLSDYRH